MHHGPMNLFSGEALRAHGIDPENLSPAQVDLLHKAGKRLLSGRVASPGIRKLAQDLATATRSEHRREIVGRLGVEAEKAALGMTIGREGRETWYRPRSAGTVGRGRKPSEKAVAAIRAAAEKAPKKLHKRLIGPLPKPKPPTAQARGTFRRRPVPRPVPGPWTMASSRKAQELKLTQPGTPEQVLKGKRPESSIGYDAEDTYADTIAAIRAKADPDAAAPTLSAAAQATHKAGGLIVSPGRPGPQPRFLVSQGISPAGYTRVPQPPGFSLATMGEPSEKSRARAEREIEGFTRAKTTL